MGEFGITGRRYLRKGGCERDTSGAYIRQEDRYNIGRHLAFRDYLRCHCEEAEHMPASRSALQSDTHMILKDTATAKRNLSRKWRKKALHMGCKK